MKPEDLPVGSIFNIRLTKDTSNPWQCVYAKISEDEYIIFNKSKSERNYKRFFRPHIVVGEVFGNLHALGILILDEVKKLDKTS